MKKKENPATREEMDQAMKALYAASPEVPCEHCGEEFPAVTLLPLSRTRREMVCGGCALEHTSGNLLARWAKK